VIANSPLSVANSASTYNSGLECKNISFSWSPTSDSSTVIADVSFQVRRGEFVSIIGPSGCGKSTLLYLLSGLKKPITGTVSLDGEIVRRPNKKIGLVFQHYTLFPWLTVQQNVEFGMKLDGTPAPDRRERAQAVLRRVGLLQAQKKYPHELSGGMQQRTAIARVLANDSEYLLMDEPFGALDLQTRLLMQRFLAEMWSEFGKAVIFVTHQVDEAVLLSDRVLLMSANPGRMASEITVSLSRPRDNVTVRFNEYRTLISEHLRREVELIFAAQACV
jgi:NitT/TauT family transport system ATP-binding protein